MSASRQQERPLVGVLEALTAGFDQVRRQPWLMIIPLLLDLFLWIGPRLEAQALYAQFEPNLRSISAELDADGRLAVQDMSGLLKDFLSHYNLFAWLSVGVVGVPAVNTAVDATAPLVTGTAPLKLPLTDVGAYVGAAIGLSAVGLLLGGLFWAMLTLPLRAEPFGFSGWLRSGLAVGGQLLLLAVVTVMLAVILMFPVSILMALIGAVSLGLASLLPALIVTAAVWVIFYLAFTVHGLALYRLPLARALRISALVARIFFVSTLGLATLSVVIYVGLGLVWELFAPDSWLRLIAMAGNAFIAAGLASASLIFYQNRSTILSERLNLPQLSNL
ncbi:MAG: hypothetical protein HY870_08255 [Chloroflexi bacterium]|nr:hypothetical protein [Chloroflexota bacterium]